MYSFSFYKKVWFVSNLSSYNLIHFYIYVDYIWILLHTEDKTYSRQNALLASHNQGLQVIYIVNIHYLDLILNMPL